MAGRLRCAPSCEKLLDMAGVAAALAATRPLEKDELVLVGVETETKRRFAAESVLGKLRGDLWRLGQEAGALEPFRRMRDAETPLRFLWVDAFPLFERGEDGSLRSTHHPFTAPDGVATVEEMRRCDVTKLLSSSCDLVLNGNEVGGG